MIWLLLWEDFGRLIDVELGQILGIEQWPPILWCCEHRCQEATGARASDDIKVVCDPRIRPIQFLEFLFKESEDGGWDDPSDATTIDAQDGDQLDLVRGIQGCTFCGTSTRHF